MMTRLFRGLTFPVLACFAIAMWIRSSKTRIGGLQVAVLYDSSEPAPNDLVDAVSDAMDLLQRRSPEQYRRVVHSLRRIAIVPKGHARYWHAFRVCVLGGKEIADWHTSVVASTIVHEATHAWLRTRGCSAPTRTTLPQHERICLRAQIRFAKALPIHDRMLASLEQQMERLSPGAR